MEFAIEQLGASDKKALKRLYAEVKANLRESGIRQWDWMYPNGFVIGRDLRRGHAHGTREDGRISAAVTVDFEMAAAYAGLDWIDAAGKPASIHRLAVHPSCQGRGWGKRLLTFAEERARAMGATSIRLDVYTGNPGAVAMYRKAGYREVGQVRFPMRELPFLCMEKLLDGEHFSRIYANSP